MGVKRNISVTSGLAKPDFTAVKRKSKKFSRLFNYAMYYAHYELGDKRLKTETVHYAKKNKIDHKILEELENYRFSAIGKAAYLLNNGAELSEEWQMHFENEIPKLIDFAKYRQAEKNDAVTEEKPNKPGKVISIQDRLKEKASQIASNFDGWVDEWMMSPSSFDIKKYDPLKLMRQENLKAAHVRHIVNFYENDQKEIEEAIKGEDEYIKESYAVYTKTQLKKILALYLKIKDACDMISATTKVQRKKKPVSVSKQVEKLKYAKESVDLGVVSINPVDIPGAQELWIYNIKTRKLGKYIAKDSTGLSVKGTTILNFTTSSVEKTIRKPGDTIANFRKSTKRAQRKFLDTIKTLDIKLSGRINEHCILLKVLR